MSKNRVVVLPSGAKLEITPAPFADAKRLYAALASEMKKTEIKSEDQLGVNLLKNVVCAFIDSPDVSAAIEVCFQRCTYNGTRIADPNEIFDSVKAREDFLTVCKEVVKENVGPFTKNLSALFKEVREAVERLQGSS